MVTEEQIGTITPEVHLQVPSDCLSVWPSRAGKSANRLGGENVARPVLRQPSVFKINDNFEGWEYQVCVCIHGVSPSLHTPYIISFLDKEAGRDFRSTGVEINSSTSVILRT